MLLGLVSFLVVLFLMTDPATLRGRYMLVTTMQSAGGIRRGDPVQMRGVNVGRIHGFTMEPNGTVAITMELSGEWKVPEGSSAVLAGDGLLGGRTMEILPGGRPGFVQPWDTIPGSSGSGGIMGSLGRVGGKTTTLIDSIQAILNQGTVSSVRGSATQLDTLLTQLSSMVREQRSGLRQLTRSLAHAAGGLDSAAAAGPDAALVVRRADSAVAVLTKTGRNLDDASASLRVLLDRIDRGEGTLGKLSKDDSLYVNLNRAAASIADLMDDVRAHPKRYINLSIF